MTHCQTLLTCQIDKCVSTQHYYIESDSYFCETTFDFLLRKPMFRLSEQEKDSVDDENYDVMSIYTWHTKLELSTII